MTTTTLFLRLCLAGSLSSLALLSTGCENEAAENRASAQDTIRDSSVQYGEAGRSGAATALTSVVDKISAVARNEHAVDGQKSAAAIIEGSARLDVAKARLIEAMWLETKHRSRRASLEAMALSGMRLENLAAREAAYTSDAEHRVLAEAGELAERSLASFKQQAASLEGPINDLKGKNSASNGDVMKLREQTRSLREQAFDAGDRLGFDEIVRAVELDRRADQIEQEIVAREIQLSELEAQHLFATNRADQLSKTLVMARDAGDNLQSVDAFHAQQARDIRSQLGSVKTRVGDGKSEIAGAAALASAYSEAIDAIDRAISAAASDSNARMMKARAYQLKGEVYASKARGLADHAGLLGVLSTTGDTYESSAGLRTQLNDTVAGQQQAASDAKDAFDEAALALDGVRGIDASALGLLKAYLTAAAGGPLDLSNVPAAPGGGAGGGTGSAAELLARLQSMEATNDALGMLALMHPTSPAATSALNVMRPLISAFDALEKAAVAQFGTGLGDELQGATGMTSNVSFANATITNETADSATVSMTDGMGNPTSANLIKVNGRWMIDADSIMGDELSDPQAMAMMNAMVPAMTQGLNDLTRRIRSGEFASIDDLNSAMMEAMLGGGG